MNLPDQTSALLKDIFRFTPEFEKEYPEALAEIEKGIAHVLTEKDGVFEAKALCVLTKLNDTLHSKDFRDCRINSVRLVTSRFTFPLKKQNEGERPSLARAYGLMIFSCFEGNHGWHDHFKKFGLTALYSSDCKKTEYGLFCADVQQQGVTPYYHKYSIYPDKTVSRHSDNDLHKSMNDRQWEFIGTKDRGAAIQETIMDYPNTPQGRARHERLWALKLAAH